jgi:hypothetical protein
LHEFDFDFWISWTVNDITETIKRCRDRNTVSDDKVIAMEHANLLKILGKRPEEPVDPLRNEKHQFYIMVNVNNQSIKLDLNSLHKLPEDTLRELNRALIGGREIDDQGAVEIMQS